ncbi:MAG: type II secretion system GspH family protein [Chitinispirillales bacterium]|jgi:hypothetical protein|nr:type II secretion system GspH family protein [Chitinispirillales bacterium]
MMIKNNKSPANGRLYTKKGGFTIVELLISAVIMIIATFAVIVVVRKATDIDVEDHHTRQARMIIMEIFERDFDYRMYASGLYGNGKYQIQPDQTSFETEFDVVIDSRDLHSEPLMGRLSLKVEHDEVTAGALNVDIHRVTAMVIWTEIGEVMDTVTLSKILAATE